MININTERIALTMGSAIIGGTIWVAFPLLRAFFLCLNWLLGIISEAVNYPTVYTEIWHLAWLFGMTALLSIFLLTQLVLFKILIWLLIEMPLELIELSASNILNESSAFKDIEFVGD